MSNSEKKINTRLQFDHLPPKFRNKLNQFNKEGFIPDNILPEIEISLLDAINNQEVSSGYSPIYPKRIRLDINELNELIVWLGVNFSIKIKKESESFFCEKPSKQLCLIRFDEYERYEFIWENDIENKIKDHDDIIDITIIENYEEMLPLVMNFKKAMNQKMGYLPSLGVKNNQGNWFLLDKGICRPIYKIIKDDPRISLKVCICTLLGIDDLSLIVSINGHLDYIIEEQEKYSWEDDFYILPSVHADNSHRDVIATAKYREGWRDVISFIKDFVFEIIEASNEGSIKWFDHSTLTGYTRFSLHDIEQETHKCYFKTHSFLKWAKKSGYAIPDELLSLIENDDGTLQTDHNIESDKIYTFPGKQITSWEDLEIILTTYAAVTIKTKHDDSIKLTFQQLGMANKQNPEKPKEVWQMLMVFAKLNGKYPNTDFPDASLEKAKDRVKEFNESLKNFFNLNESIYKNHYKKNRCWETKFVIKSQLEVQQPRQESKSLHEIEVEDAQRKSNISDSQLYQY